ncbi:hypothetical protein VRU48_15030 [Pedobacter sp. KR3-3]|uniref:Uncharacterized protein n=1 Tax=Pedobacter albus TaxID=3113905 RepID=A0ABU7IAX8_9SPHI|nr:hypothetical protein [Pedobacter sp. KR3-3]MEE1946436.1 hypothetical protein [Pedobacter sp. KR3-3]
MNRYEFSQSGIDEKLATLYASSEEEIAIEAEQANADFAKWVDDNFILTADELAFLYRIDPKFLGDAGVQTAQAITDRVPIKLTRFPRPGEGGEKYIITRPSKWSLEFEIGWIMMP